MTVVMTGVGVSLLHYPAAVDEARSPPSLLKINYSVHRTISLSLHIHTHAQYKYDFGAQHSTVIWPSWWTNQRLSLTFSVPVILSDLWTSKGGVCQCPPVFRVAGSSNSELGYFYFVFTFTCQSSALIRQSHHLSRYTCTSLYSYHHIGLDSSCQ